MALTLALLVAHDAVRRGQEDELCAFGFGGIGFLFDGGHVFALAAVDDGDVRTLAQRGAGRIDGRIAAADNHDFAAKTAP